MQLWLEGVFAVPPQAGLGFGHACILVVPSTLHLCVCIILGAGKHLAFTCWLDLWAARFIVLLLPVTYVQVPECPHHLKGSWGDAGGGWYGKVSLDIALL